MTFKAWQSDGRELLTRLRTLLRAEGIDAAALVSSSENPAYDKFDTYIPAELLRRAFVADRLNPEEVLYRILHGFSTGEEKEEI